MVTRALRSIVGYGERTPGKRLIVDAVGLAFLVAVGFVIWVGASRQSEAALQGKQAHDYLCHQKLVVIPRHINTALRYITDVQLGNRRPIPGITIQDIEHGINDDQDQLDQLRVVKCK